MKNFTFLILLLTISLGFSQTWSTGLINLSTDYDAKIDITATEVTLTLIAPNNIWFGIGFGGTSMNSSDIFRTNGTTIVDASPTNHSLPTADTNQDWVLDSNTNNTPSTGLRTMVAHRVLDTSEAGDHVFSTSDTSISLIWAKGSSTTYAYHANRGVTSSNITLGIDDNIFAENFKIFPNPAATEINIKLSNIFETGSIKVYNILGKQVFNKVLSSLSTSIDVTTWSKGVYVIKVEVGNRSQTKRFIKQ